MTRGLAAYAGVWLSAMKPEISSDLGAHVARQGLCVFRPHSKMRGLCVYVLGTRVSPAKTAEPIEMPFGSTTLVGPGKHLLHIADRFGRMLYCVHSTQYSFLVISVKT